MTEGLTRFRYDLLAVLASYDRDGGVYGLQIKRDLERVYSEEVNHGRLYPNLDILVERGLVQKRKKDDRTNTYELTEQGVRELERRYQFLKDSITESFVIEHGSSGVTFRSR